MRMLLGLVRPTSGPRDLRRRTRTPTCRTRPAPSAPCSTPASSTRATGRGPRCGIIGRGRPASPDRRVDEVLDAVGLTDAARRRVGGFSMGMRQRLALAAALLGDPETLVLDEPSNGLDPEGMRWLRGFLKRLAGEGRTVLSPAMSWPSWPRASTTS